MINTLNNSYTDKNDEKINLFYKKTNRIFDEINFRFKTLCFIDRVTLYD